MKHIHILFSFVFVVLSISNVYGQSDDFQISRGDVLSIDVMEHPEFNRTGILVLPDGTVQYPAIGSIFVAGRTPKSLSDTIQGLLNVRYVVNPIVTVYVNRIYNESVNVFGAVNNPGRYQIYEPMELMMALGMAGGIKDMRKVTDVLIMRQNGEIEVINLKKLIRKEHLDIIKQTLIYPEDTIVVEARDFNWGQLSFFTTLSYALIRIIELLFL
jgi:polysaccharide biosynthesis/export protein